MRITTIRMKYLKGVSMEAAIKFLLAINHPHKAQVVKMTKGFMRGRDRILRDFEEAGLSAAYDKLINESLKLHEDAFNYMLFHPLLRTYKLPIKRLDQSIISIIANKEVTSHECRYE